MSQVCVHEFGLSLASSNTLITWNEFWNRFWDQEADRTRKVTVGNLEKTAPNIEHASKAAAITILHPSVGDVCVCV